MLFVRFSRLLTHAKQDLLTRKTYHQLHMRAFLADSNFEAGEKVTHRRNQAALMCLDDEQRVVEAKEEVSALESYLSCVERALSAVKHFRDDIARVLKMLDLENGHRT